MFLIVVSRISDLGEGLSYGDTAGKLIGVFARDVLGTLSFLIIARG